MYSPLEDILQKKKEVWRKAMPESSRFGRLLTLLPFEGFIGIPIPATESAHYGLILFKESQNFRRREYQLARSAVYQIAQVLQERRLVGIFQPWQAQNLIGQLASSIVHEVNSKLGGIELLVQRLQDGLKELARWPEKAGDATFLRELEEAVEDIAKAQYAATELRNWYLGLTVTDEQQLVDLTKLASEMVRALRSQAQEHNVALHLKSAGQLPAVQARPSQLQQIFLNLILNAIQQMAEIKQTGKLTIEISYSAELPLPLQIRFQDDGPGIHYYLWEQIFDFGFTTRKRGAGLGLTIARQSADSLGGRLRVVSSHVFWGTTFLLELPGGV
jgi:signal transduction histidine kinase